MAEHVLCGDSLRSRIVPDVRGEVFGKRRIQPQATSVDELKHDERENRLAQRRGVEDCMRVDKARCPGESNALTQIVIELTVTDNRHGDPRNIARRHEVAQRGLVNAHAASVAGRLLQFQGSNSSSQEAG